MKPIKSARVYRDFMTMNVEMVRTYEGGSNDFLSCDITHFRGLGRPFRTRSVYHNPASSSSTQNNRIHFMEQSDGSWVVKAADRNTVPSSVQEAAAYLRTARRA
jgi:hypothetical protein